MDPSVAAQGFAAMGSEARLEVLRVLVRAGEAGLSVGEIRDRTGIAASTLAHHLKFLTAADVVTQEKLGRSTICRADFKHLERLAGFILSECCQDEGLGQLGKVANDG
ncbi:ArsR/SmtB family transcription factor [Tritonibacter mobilis]|uniref:ArsR/SmtB family transcription factor n=1 Tax=Tritonibacter mobilis TaxID=379347 RepID=UPI000806C141|nr:metalloregulator ArsR/SmtB family transcription factor [Tritonibacter mobilis]PXW80158.1 ArsR family transcriptional regulator [Ruegeria sp. P4]GLP87819.1 transcriptional regulator [Tritonibacter mobilis]SDX48291.1 transcriptional regulator, ArsR family [Tritonibacter mobilis]